MLGTLKSLKSAISFLSLSLSLSLSLPPSPSPSPSPSFSLHPENIINEKDKFLKGKKHVIFLKTNMIAWEPAIILNYPLHWFPLLVGIMESQWQFHQTKWEPGFSSSLCGVEEMCCPIWRREERGAETHLISFSSWPAWPHWRITENYSVTKISWLKPESCHRSEIKPCSVVLIPGSFPVVCCIIETNWKTFQKFIWKH